MMFAYELVLLGGLIVSKIHRTHIEESWLVCGQLSNQNNFILDIPKKSWSPHLLPSLTIGKGSSWDSTAILALYRAGFKHKTVTVATAEGNFELDLEVPVKSVTFNKQPINFLKISSIGTKVIRRGKHEAPKRIPSFLS